MVPKALIFKWYAKIDFDRKLKIVKKKELHYGALKDINQEVDSIPQMNCQKTVFLKASSALFPAP